jgi:acetyl-CoA carboxylase carboxyl transferase subunit beta
MAWFKKPKYTIVRTEKKTEIPEGTFTKCASCGEVVTRLQLEASGKVCPKCGHHFLLSARERVAMLLDAGTFKEHPLTMHTGDPLGFTDYPAKLAKAQTETGMEEAMIKGEGRLAGTHVALGVTDFAFMGGSMGSAMGEEITRLVEFACDKSIPLIMVSGSGGGARMQEGILSLMQMAKTAAALARLSDRGVPFLSVMTHPTGGGVTASWAILGDLNIAEPNALIMFAGARVIEQTIRQRLPKGFQRAEFLLEHGMVDMVVERSKLKETLALGLSYLKPRLTKVARA